jgi:nitroreductase
MDVFEAMRKRRMHRSFSDEAISEEVLAKLVRAAALAPMGGNELVRRLIVVSDPRVVKTVRNVTPSFLANPPALIVVCTDLDRAEASMGRQGRDILSLIDAGAAAENVALAAPALGVGVSFVRSVNDSALREVLGLPEHVRPDILIGVGHPATKPSPAAPRRDPVVFRDRFGHPWEART